MKFEQNPTNIIHHISRRIIQKSQYQMFKKQVLQNLIWKYEQTKYLAKCISKKRIRNNENAWSKQKSNHHKPEKQNNPSQANDRIECLNEKRSEVTTCTEYFQEQFDENCN
jgi:hypothetical protein